MRTAACSNACIHGLRCCVLFALALCGSGYCCGDACRESWSKHVEVDPCENCEYVSCGRLDGERAFDPGGGLWERSLKHLRWQSFGWEVQSIGRLGHRSWINSFYSASQTQWPLLETMADSRQRSSPPKPESWPESCKCR